MGSIPGGVRRAVSAGSALLLARGELAAAELAQARDAWLRWLFAAMLGCVLSAFAAMALGIALALALWDRLGWGAVALTGLVFLLAAAFVLLRLRRQMAAAPPLFAVTLAELARDREAILGATGQATERRP